MRVGYVRVSKFEQEDALVQQTARIEKAGCTLIFSDIESGKSDQRKNFNKLLAMCRTGQVTEVVITRVDRLARSVVTIHPCDRGVSGIKG
jgi:site-specific DNA recombinase